MPETFKPEALNLSAAPDRQELAAIPARVRLPSPQWFGVHRIGSKAIVRLDGEIGLTGATAGELLVALGAAPEVLVTINSVGGDTNAAFEIHDGLAGRNVSVEIVGHCFSAAVVVALAGNRIKMRPDALLMVHLAQLFVFGSAEELECGARRLRRLNTRLRELIMLRSEQPAAVVDRWLSKDSYFSATEALAIGLADEITEAMPAPIASTAPAPASEPSQTADESLFHALLRAMGNICVANKATFSRSVHAWLAHYVHECGDSQERDRAPAGG